MTLRPLRRIASRTRALGARWGHLHELRWRITSRRSVYEVAYAQQTWASGESRSGTGSELRATGNIRKCLPELLIRLGATSLLDAPCGDWNWMQHVELPVTEYFGVDIVESLITANRERFGNERRHFTVRDLTRDPLPRADVILCRDCLVHASYQDIAAMLENFRRTGATYLLLNTYPEIQHNRNQFTGRPWRRINLLLPPFGFPQPLEMFPDGGDIDPSQLALWRLQELPHVSA